MCSHPFRPYYRGTIVKSFRWLLSSLCFTGLVQIAQAQNQVQVCKDGQCKIITLVPLQEEVQLDTSNMESAAASDEDRFAQVVKATVRVTVSGICGSGTVVGRDKDENALVLTNAHVAGTQRGRTVNVERWNTDGSSERGQGAIIAAGYGRGMSVDFALLKCSSGFATGVRPVPLADRFPDTKVMVSTFGCPRCEWPSLQVLKLNKSEGQILTWKPEAIGGRSGSSVVDYTDNGPRVVGLLTWGGGGEGLGQSTPFLLQAMRGRLPQALETLPDGVREVGSDISQSDLHVATWPTKPLPVMSQSIERASDDVVDAIVEPNQEKILRPRPNDIEDAPSTRPVIGFLARLQRWIRDRVLVGLLVIVAFVVGVVWGRFQRTPLFVLPTVPTSAPTPTTKNE
jgi:V8-like Glu-specific endopeptidase